MNAMLMDNLNEMTADELKDLKGEIDGMIKAKKEEDKANATLSFKEQVVVGNEVLFLFKGTEWFGTVAKINEKTFTVEFDMDGQPVKKAIGFDKFRGLADEVEGASTEVA